MNKKIVGITIIFIGLIAIFAIMYILFFNKPATTGPNQKTDTTSKTDNVVTDTKTADDNTAVKRIKANIPDIKKDDNSPEVVRDREEVDKEDLKRIASSFVERFGSYSNQSNYSNIKDLKMFMSDKMRDWADSFIAEQIKESNANNIYYGIITKAITEEVLEYDDESGKVTILVESRRREAVGTSANFSDVFNQEIVVKFVKNRGVWKVDSANWREK